MLKGSLLLFSFLPLVAQASSSGLISVLRDPLGSIILQGPNCQELVDQDQALRLWKTHLNEIPGPTDAPTSNQDQTQCQLSINKSVPTFVETNQDFKPRHNGPNCWNSVLLLSGFNTAARFASPSEMSLWMGSPYCKELTASDLSLPGDIIAIREQNNLHPDLVDEVHGMFYISDDLVFSKNTSAYFSPYAIQRANLIFQSFRLTEEICQKTKGRSSTCRKWATHFRCHEVKEDRINFEKTKPELAMLASNTNEIELEISAYVTHGHALNGEFLPDKFDNQLSEIETQIQKITKPENSQHFFICALIEQIHSLKTQLKILKKDGAQKN